MSLLLHFSSRAVEQMTEADQWCKENRPSTPQLFQQEFTQAVALLSEYPNIGVLHSDRQKQGVRKRLLKKTGYYIYYRQDPKRPALEVLAVWSTKRGQPPSL